MQQHALPKRGQREQGPNVRLQELWLQTGTKPNHGVCRYFLWGVIRKIGF